jgi:hypothetical protein
VGILWWGLDETRDIHTIEDESVSTGYVGLEVLLDQITDELVVDQASTVHDLFRLATNLDVIGRFKFTSVPAATAARSISPVAKWQIQ